MSSRKGRRLSAVAALGLGTLMCTVGPAQAVLAAPVADAYVVSADAIAGLVAVPPTPHSNFPGPPGPGTVTTLGIAVGPFASNSLLTATTAGDPTAGTSSASATVDSLNVNLPIPTPISPTTLSVTGVNSTCTAPAAPGKATGSGVIASGTVTVDSLIPVTLQANAAPNTSVSVPGLGTIILNEQSTDANGVLTVNAVHLTLLPALNGLNLIIGHAQCGGAPPTQPVPMVNPQVGLSLGAMAIAGSAVVYRRRRNGIDTEGC